VARTIWAVTDLVLVRKHGCIEVHDKDLTLIAGMASRSTAAVCHSPAPASNLTASSVVSLSTIPLISALAKSEGAMD
jgi:hypothetical protein